ncbi:unnamed protein product [Brassicogethes aeneus]|uniref:Uncharacterized protein n=1 Tax=Brassicogethes aeneus TaxID=1431903 RepID=A0A9P0FNQ9_BRAAE|nr:unnamed protein product [Brassicogethes aeneus]
MHPGCTKYFRNIKKIDENTILCCEKLDEKSDNVIDDLDSSSESVTTVIDNNVEVAYLKKLLDEKDNAIGYLKDNIAALNEQIKVLNLLVNLRNPMTSQIHEPKQEKALQKSTSQSTHVPSTYIDVTTRNKNTKTKISNKNKVNNESTKNESKQTNKISKEQVKNAINQAFESSNMGKTIEQVNRSKSTIYGTKNVEEIAVEKKAWLFISRFKTSFSTVDMENYLKAIQPNGSHIVKQLTNQGYYNSFKVGIDLKYKEDFLKDEVWPVGIIISNFTFKRKMIEKI